ncbi:MAG: RsmE family RNA methyltransferase [Rubrobacter sp.]
MSTLTRIFIASNPEPGESFTLLSEEAHHLTKVLRTKPGDGFEAVTASGRVCLAELGEGGLAVLIGVIDGSSEALSTSSISSTAARQVVLYQAVPKGKRMEVVVEKATEVGVGRIVPILTERSVVKPGEGNKLERWRRIAESAARQSLRVDVPEVVSPVEFSEAVREAGVGIILHNAPDLPVFERAVGGREGDISLFIGHEGGWTEGELRLAEESGVSPAQMGPYRLRSETAGLVAVVRARTAIELAGANVAGHRLSVEDTPEEGRSE